MKNVKKLLALLLALVMVVGILAGCTGNEDTTPSNEDTQGATEGSQGATETTGASVEDGPQYGGHADIRFASTLTGLDPSSKTGAWHYQWTTAVFENILTRDLEGNIRPGVCDFELSEDELTLKVWVRDGMVFHNGDTVDIYDVEASLKRAMNLNNSLNTKLLPYVASMEVDPADETLTMVFSEWRETVYYYIAAYQPWAAVMPKEFCEKYAEEFNTQVIEDAIGTGPYMVTGFEDNVSLTLSKFEDYVVQESDYTGFAGPKYGYLDSMTFWQNRDDASASLALLSGDYDLTECISSDYKNMWESEGIVETTYPTINGLHMFFNGFGNNNVCAKYPSMRKAVMAAIDYEEFLSVVTDDQQIMGGCPILGDKYDTDVFETADYYGEPNQEAVDKYLAMAKEEGWNGTDPVVNATSDHRGDIPVLLDGYMKAAGIPFEAVSVESGSVGDFRKNPDNIWDLDFTWPTYAESPTLLPAASLTTYWNNPEKDALLEKMYTMVPGTEEYMESWEELSQMWVDDCFIAFMGETSWYWYHDGDLVTNDFDTLTRNWFNAYWKNPEEHQD